MDALIPLLKDISVEIPCIVPYSALQDKLEYIDLSNNNQYLTTDIFSSTAAFSVFIDTLMAGARYGYGGYLEHRNVYTRSSIFGTGLQLSEERSIHLGIDIWGAAGTAVRAPLSGKVHSKGYHPEFGNYGAAIILEHAVQGQRFYTLYGHLALQDLAIPEGSFIQAGQPFAHFGIPEENGNWPPHLHFQIVKDLQNYIGDYPGVCAPSQIEFYTHNCPDASLLLHWH